MADAERLALHGRKGAIRGYALIDAADAELARRYRWHLSTGYARSAEGILLHRLLLGLRSGDGLEGDHRNRDRLDCRRSNLRVVTRPQNQQNLGVRPCSKHRGVGRHPRGAWRARVVVDGREYSRRTRTRAQAVRAVRELRALHMPFSAEAATA